MSDRVTWRDVTQPAIPCSEGRGMNCPSSHCLDVAGSAAPLAGQVLPPESVLLEGK